MILPGKSVEYNVTKKFRNKLFTRPELETIFDEQVKSIIWKTKLSEDTIQIPSGKEVQEIEFFWLEVNTRTFDEQIIRFFDRKIGCHVIFILENNGRIQIWLSDKTAKETTESLFTVKKYYHTKWFFPEMLFLFENGNNLDEVYLSLFKQIQQLNIDNVLLYALPKIAKHSQEIIENARKYIPLSQQEIEKILANKPLSDQQKEKITNSYLRVAIRLAFKFFKRCVGVSDSMDECIADSRAGLMKAIDSYDVNVHGYFSSYAERRIWETMEQGREDRNGEIHLPTHIHELLRKIQLVEVEFYREYAREPTMEEYVKMLHLSSQKIREMLTIRQEAISLATPIGEDEESKLEDFIQDKSILSPEQNLEQTLQKQEITRTLETLSAREAKVLSLRFGLEDGIEHSLQEIGRMINISGERVRKIEERAIRKMRHPKRTKMLKDYQ